MDVVLTEGSRAHSAYVELIENPPEGVRYLRRPMDWGHPVWGSPARNALFWKLRGLRLKLQGAPVPVSVPDWGAPVHSTVLVTRSPQPFLMNYEHPGALADFAYDNLDRPAPRRRLARYLANPACRALVPWTEAAASATRAIAPDAASRIRVVRPAIKPRPRAVPPDEDAPLVLFVGNRFHRKGGIEALEAFRKVREERCPRARMLMISDAPPDVVAKYLEHGVTIRQVPVPRDEVLAEGFAKASVFMLPTHLDTFGMVFLEAFAHGLPIVTTPTFAIDEIVDEGKDGFVVAGYSRRWFHKDGTHVSGLADWERLQRALPASERPRIVADLARALGDLLEDPALAHRMGDHGRAKVTEGRFSIGVRNAELRRVYDEAFTGA